MEGLKPKIEQSENDKNVYEYFELPNGVKVMLIQDLNTKSTSDTNFAYCSVSVNAGGFNDPDHRGGLAHFLEHMIFMGSQKYPDEKAFST